MITSLNADGMTLGLKPGIEAKYQLYWYDENGNHHPYENVWHDFDASYINAKTQTYTVNEAYKEMYVRVQYCADQNSSGGLILAPYADCAGTGAARWEGGPIAQGKYYRYHMSDKFAVRPHHFTAVPPAGKSMHLLHSATDTRLTLYAMSGANGTTQGTTHYNQTKSNLSLTATRYMGDGSVDNGGLLSGAVGYGSLDFNMTDGISTRGGQHDVADITYDDVGNIDVKITDSDWGAVDIINGYSLNQNCNNPPHETLSTPNGFKICGDINMTFIPDHFQVTGVTLKNHKDSAFTYVSNDWNMSASFDVKIVAKNAKGSTTVNFRQPDGSNVYYENPVDVDIAFLPSVNTGGATVQTHTIDNLLGFGQPDFANGEHDLVAADPDFNKNLAIRGTRDTTKPVNPFIIKGSDINVSVESTYTDTAKGISDTIKGGKEGTGSATFLYGRLHAPRYRVSSAAGSLPVYYEFYYDVNPGIEDNTTLSGTFTGSGNADRSKDAFYWYKNNLHQTRDGNITGISQYNFSDLTLGYNAAATNGIQYINYNYGGNDFPYRATIKISTQPWLIYNRYDAAATTVDVPLEINSGTLHNQGSGADSDAVDATQRPRRIEW